MDHDEYLASLGLACLTTIGPNQIRRLREHFGSAAALWAASARELRERGVPDELAGRLVSERSRVDTAEEDARCRQTGIEFLPLTHPRFPLLLKEITDPPTGLFVRGTLMDAALTIAVVGTRAASSYGRQVTREITADLARAGVIVVSGLALGIDAAAHEAALQTGQTVAVLPCGLHTIYPRANTKLAERIVERGGALCSELPLGREILKHHFAVRNRIVAGLARGVLVTEAPARSGALLTAQLAVDYNRDVFAVPGPITAFGSAGTHKLLRSGAALVTCATDILESYRIATPLPDSSRSPLTETERAVLELIGREPTTVDQIQNMSRLNTSVINATLLCLQVKGWITAIDALHFVRT